MERFVSTPESKNLMLLKGGRLFQTALLRGAKYAIRKAEEKRDMGWDKRNKIIKMLWKMRQEETKPEEESSEVQDCEKSREKMKQK